MWCHTGTESAGHTVGDHVVAVKSTKKGVSDDEKIKFLQEAAIMGQFDHPYIVKVFGIVVTHQKVLFDTCVHANRSHPTSEIIGIISPIIFHL